jgi:hypothetical protein
MPRFVELEIDGFIHRYVLTNQPRDRDGNAYTVLNYDGKIDPMGARPAQGHRTGASDRHRRTVGTPRQIGRCVVTARPAIA